ncbi:MAG TPA: thiamine pyrophosphate-dependent dehydrogenase E1 component subunit alpha [Kiritimatiellia bacterium]|nr:thiamine pyrophosphate-dependent dehydrogenase E1 component subunit alpha [Kiritimatiellia bacterium]HOR98278.1 thiamine pyrophosphate-dependent dehydrogenase E1 component subunit alpha [Kiritimatiellia bacterium]HPC49374.1 thiamine pyrophosphate-dependent dehydrogenase E1 component subunit alpha [Kiritimatiellia bacterium]HPK37292.1 thiamine pyrophosphate-dependent dehydrogenase E1 component subunit alpha [Kiritimatiellia bacterium]HRU19480.1 thiamine pyrophosphate-dependent dehydrogenase E
MDALSLYDLMLTIRFFEEAIERLFLEGRIMGTAHTCIGQEAVAVGVAAALEPCDALTTTHRGHGHFLARGADPGRALAELFGRAVGYSRGLGGSQMMMDVSRGFYGANGITGGSIPFATGLALEAQYRKTGRVTACLFGDGASNQGVFHESLNLAALWKLPVLYIVENNGYAMSTATARGLADPCVAGRAAAYGIPGERVDGNDVLAVRDIVARHAARARAGKGPSLIECVTYRLSGHSRGDPRVYRSREEEAQAWSRDPIRLFEARLLAEGVLGEADVAARHEAAQQRIETAIAFCEAAELPDPEILGEPVFA